MVLQLNRLTAIFLTLEWSSLEFLPSFFLARRFPDTCPPDGYRKLWTGHSILGNSGAFQYSGTEALELWDRFNITAASLALIHLCLCLPLPCRVLLFAMPFLRVKLAITGHVHPHFL